MTHPYQQQVDHQHLRLLALFHYIHGGLLFLGAFFLISYIFLMRWLFGQSAGGGLPGSSGGTPPQEFDQLFLMIGVVYGLMGLFALAVAVANIFAGAFLQRRRSRIFLFVVSGLNCLNLPLGTILAIFTILVLLRPSVVAEFEAAAKLRASSPPPADA